jgi:hypothetical protein
VAQAYIRLITLMRVRLIRKLAERLDGVDISHYVVGDVLEVAPREARLLIAEEWAERAARGRTHTVRPRLTSLDLGGTADAGRRNPTGQLQRVSEQIERRWFEPHQGRRVEDRLLQELHDSRAHTVRPTVLTPRHAKHVVPQRITR